MGVARGSLDSRDFGQDSILFLEDISKIFFVPSLCSSLTRGDGLSQRRKGVKESLTRSGKEEWEHYMDSILKGFGKKKRE